MKELFNTSCSKCSNGVYCREAKMKICIAGAGSPLAEIMVIAEAPDRDDGAAGTVMQSKKDGLLNKIFSEVIGADMSRIYYTYLVKCKVDPNSNMGNIPQQEHINACLEYLQNEIELIKPKVIVTLGETVTQALLGGSNIPKLRGNIFLKELFGHTVKIIPTYSPGYVTSIKSKLKDFATDLNKAYLEGTGLIKGVRRSENETVETIERFKEIVGYILDTKQTTMDFESWNLELNCTREENRITGLALSINPGYSWFIPLEHPESPFNEAEVFVILEYYYENVLLNPEIIKIGHNLKFDLHLIRIYGFLGVRGVLHDTMLMAQLLDETTSNGLKENVKEYFPQFGDYEKENEAAVKKFGWAKVPLNILSPYSGMDADATGRLYIYFSSELLRDERLYIYYRSLTMGAFLSLMEAEAVGTKVNKEYLAEAIQTAKELVDKWEGKLREHPTVKKFEKEMAQYQIELALEKIIPRIEKFEETRETKIKALEQAGKKGKIPPVTITETKLREKVRGLKAGTLSVYDGLNFGSPDQLKKLLYTKEGFAFKMIKDWRGNVLNSSKKEVLLELKKSDNSGFIDELQIWRSLSKMHSTYLLGIYERLDVNDRVHTQFKQHIADTGRLSSADPNMQNLPVLSKLTNEDAVKVVQMVKQSIIPSDEDHTFVGVDYSQIELRIIAVFANEPTMLKVYADDGDLHAVTASKLVRKSLEEFMALPKEEVKKWRTRAKAGNFGLIYLISAQGFKEYAKNNYNVELSDKEVADFMEVFFKTYPELHTYHEIYKAKAKQFGYVRTLFGRKRRTPEIHSTDSFLRGMDERVSVNSPIQGTAGEITIFAAALLRHRLNPRTKFILNVHDALYFDIPDDLLHSEIKMIQYTCENLPMKMYFGRELNGVKLKVEIETSKKSWKDIEPYAVEN